jgi:hypothetical protein
MRLPALEDLARLDGLAPKDPKRRGDDGNPETGHTFKSLMCNLRALTGLSGSELRPPAVGDVDYRSEISITEVKAKL